MPKLVDAAAQRSEIRHAARRVFARRGVRATGLAHVADAAGLARSSLYHYYPDKKALIRDLARELLADEERLFARAAQAPGAPLDRVAELAGTATRLFDEWAALGRVVFDLRMLESPRFRSYFRRIREHLAAVVGAGQASGEIDATLDPELAAAAVIGLIDGLLLQHFADPHVFEDREALAAQVERLVRKALSS